jgi:hypothetical protein
MEEFQYLIFLFKIPIGTPKNFSKFMKNLGMRTHKGSRCPAIRHTFWITDGVVNPLALELNIYSLAHHLCKMLIFYEPRRIT